MTWSWLPASRADVARLHTHLDDIIEGITAMAVREDAAYDNLNATILTVKEGWASLVAERDQYKAALENADADKAAAVAAALDADSDVDAEKVEAANAALAELVADEPATEAPADDVPADEPAPAEDVPAEDAPVEGDAPTA